MNLQVLLLLQAFCWTAQAEDNPAVGKGHIGCGDTSFILLDSVHHNNLGGKGPHHGAEGITYIAQEHSNGTSRRIHVNMNALTPYDPWDVWANGMNGGFGMFNQNSGHGVTLQFSFTDAEGKPITLPAFSVSVYDMDMDRNNAGIEEVIAHDYEEAFVTKTTTVKRRFDANGKEVFFGGVYGNFDDNPVHVIHQSQRGKDKSIAFNYRNVRRVVMTFRSTPTNSPRFSQISFLNALQCAMEEERAEHPMPPTVQNPPTHVTHVVIPGEPFEHTISPHTFQSNAGGQIVMSATQVDGSPLPAWLKFHPKTGSFKGHAPKSFKAEITVKVVATDTLNGLTASTSLIFRAPGGPVLAVPMPSKLVEAGADISFTVPERTFVGTGTDTLKLSARKSDGSSLPSWLKFDPQTQVFSGRVPDGGSSVNLQIKLTATDEKGKHTDAFFSIMEAGTHENNHPPLVESLIPLQHAKVGDRFSYQIPGHLFIDPDGDALTLRVHALGAPTSGLSSGTLGWLHQNERGFYGTPTQQDAGVSSIKLCASDSHDHSVCTTFTVQVEGLGGPTVGKAVGPQHARVGQKFSLTLSKDTFVAKPGGLPLKLEATQADGNALPKWLRFDQASQQFSGTPGPGDSGIVVKIAATDPEGNSASNIFDLDIPQKVQPTNHLPHVRNPPGSKEALIGSPLKFKIADDVFSDADGDYLTVKATSVDGSPVPSWLHHEASKGRKADSLTFSGKPDKAGDFWIMLTATDGKGTSANTGFKLTVKGGGPIPGGSLEPVHAEDGQKFSFTLPVATFKSSDGGALVLQATQLDGSALPKWLHFNPEHQVFTGTPESTGSIAIQLTATDRLGRTAKTILYLEVQKKGQEKDAPPKARNPPKAKSVSVNSLLKFEVPDNVFSDEDEDYLTVKATAIDGSPLPSWLHHQVSKGHKADKITFSGRPNKVGEHWIMLTAVDASGSSAQTGFKITVTGGPSLNHYISFQRAVVGQPFSFNLPSDTFGSSPNDKLHFKATAPDGSPLPAWLHFGGIKGTFSGTPGLHDIGDTEVKISATDASGISASDTFPIVVSKPALSGQGPVGVSDLRAKVGYPFLFKLPENMFDLSAKPVKFEASQADGSKLPKWLHFNPATQELWGTPSQGDAHDTPVEITATDHAGKSASTVLHIHVDGAALRAKVGQPFLFKLPENMFLLTAKPVKFEASQLDGSKLPKWLHFIPAKQELSGTPGQGDAQDTPVKITATDHAGKSASTVLHILVDGATLRAKIGHPFLFKLPENMFDLSAKPVKFEASQPDGSELPNWLHFNPAKQELSGTPGQGDAQDTPVKITATDHAGKLASTVLPIHVDDAALRAKIGHPFLFKLPENMFDLTAKPVKFEASQPDGSKLPKWMHFNPAKQELLGTPGQGDAQDTPIRITATDHAGKSASTVLPIHVAKGGPHLKNPVSLQRAIAGKSFSFKLPHDVFEAPPGDTLKLIVSEADGSSLPKWLRFNEKKRTFYGEPDTDDIGDYEVKLTATDDNGNYALDVFPVIVGLSGGGPRVKHPIALQRGHPNVSFRFKVAKDTFKPSGDRLHEEATRPDGSDLPEWLRFNRKKQAFLGTPAPNDTGVVEVKLTATDDAGRFASDTFPIEVMNRSNMTVLPIIIADAPGVDPVWWWLLLLLLVSSAAAFWICGVHLMWRKTITTHKKNMVPVVVEESGAVTGAFIFGEGREMSCCGGGTPNETTALITADADLEAPPQQEDSNDNTLRGNGKAWSRTGYTGSLENGKRSGQGKQIYNDGRVYVGEFAKNRLHGKGTLSSNSGNLIYTGEWQNDLMHGTGKEVAADGVYEGSFEKDQRHGQGTLTDANGRSETGTWDRGERLRPLAIEEDAQQGEQEVAAEREATK